MDNSTSIGHVPNGKWEFDGEVTACFDDMLRRSIPQYDLMRQTVFDLACKYAKRSTDIIDLGCSRGEAMAPLVDKFGVNNRYTGVEVSEPMLETCRARFAGLIKVGIVDIRRCDLRTEYPPVSASVTLCILTLQFTPIEYRMQICKRIFDHTVAGGALLLVEKLLGESAETDATFAEQYYSMKNCNGYSQDEIARKRMALEGVLVPVTAKWNEHLLQAAGFSKIECFWRWMNFAGWLAVR